MPTTNRRAFTLVELLVVIAILIVLGALVFSVSGKMFKAARATTCANNLRQISPIVHSIRDEGVDTGGNTPPGCFPPYAGQISEPSTWRKFNIYELLGEKAGVCEFRDGAYRWSMHPSETFLQNPLSEHKLAGDIEKAEDLTNDNFQSFGGFGYNTLIEGWTAVHTSSPKQTRMFDIDFPSLTIIMAEQNPKHQNAPIWFGPWKDVTPAGTYKESVHCLFVDGHVEVLRNEYLDSQEGRKKHIHLNAGF